jgi:hypothetical protein
MVIALATTLMLGASQPNVSLGLNAVELARKWTEGEKLAYSVRAQFTEEERSGDLQTFIPNDQDLNYKFFLDVKKIKADGIAEMIYTRPTMDIVLGDTSQSSARTLKEKLDWKLQLDVSPFNEMINLKDLNPPKEKKPGASGRFINQRIFAQFNQSDGVALSLLGQFLEEVQRLAFFVGPLDSGLDFAPRTPFEEIEVGGTWKKTVGYQPQKLKGQGDKQAVQRLDYTYTYKGLVKSTEGKDVQRIQAIVKLDTDLTDFARQLVGASRASSMLKSIPLKFDATIDFDLDPKTFHMVKAAAKSEGSFAIEVKGAPQPAVENRFRGRTRVKLDSWVLPPKPTKPNGGKKGG